MEQFRHIGKVIGDLKALMVFRDEIQINQRQCCLLVDIFNQAYVGIAEEIKHNLRFEEKQTKWKALEQPLKELHRIFKEGAHYIQQCLETKDLWAKAISLAQNKDCVEFHIHNFMCCIPIVIEAIELVGEISGSDHDVIQKKRYIISSKYEKKWKDPKLFQWKFGKQYIVSQDVCNQVETAWKEDRWTLLQTIKGLRSLRLETLSKQDQQLTELLLKKLDDSELSSGTMFPASFVVGSKDYQVRRRLGNGSEYREIQWLGESFVVRTFFEDIEHLIPTISLLSSIIHPNVMHFLCGFSDEERKESFLLMELMNKDLYSYIKEISSPRKRVPFSLLVAVDLMLQIARGMEYLHSHRIYHGDLSPFNILVKARNSSSDGYLHAKVTGFSLSSMKNCTPRSYANQQDTHPFIWYAPEVLSELEQPENVSSSQHTEKADIYSFGMICFVLSTGRVPFEDVQGDKISRTIRAGERPFIPSCFPKYLTNLIRRCWQTDPIQRPSFSSICRILRYIKRFLLMNPEHNLPDAFSPIIDYCDIENELLKKFATWGFQDPIPVSQIPFHMFAYRVLEKEKITLNLKERSSESGSEGASLCGDEHTSMADDPFSAAIEMYTMSPVSVNRSRVSTPKKFKDGKVTKQPGTPKGRSARPPALTTLGRNLTLGSDSHLHVLMSPSNRRRRSGHSSDSDLP